eukprot:2978605-Pleurochrysis_carterae.AAC.1
MVWVRGRDRERSPKACVGTLTLEERVRHRDAGGERVREGELEKGLRRAGANHPVRFVRPRLKGVHSRRHVRAELGGRERGREIVRRAREHGQ